MLRGIILISLWSNSFSILLCEGPKTINFMICWFLDVTRPTKTNMIYIWRRQDTSEKVRKLFQKTYVWIYKVSRNLFDGNSGKDGHRQTMKIRLNISWKAWIWDLPENTSCKCGNMASTAFKKHQILVTLWNQETKQPKNFETKQVWNQDTLSQ